MAEANLTTSSLTAGQKRRLAHRQDTLQAEWDLRSEKVKRMRDALVIETGTAVRFQLEKQLLDEEAQLARLADELDEIEQALQ